MGESKLKLAKREEMLLSCAGVQTAGGLVQVRWESESAATPMGQLAYFIEFLTLTGLWSRWRDGCPLSYASPNAPSKADVLGTWMLSALSGHRRYSPVTAIRCDGVNPGLLGMNKVISEDALRRALAAIPEAAGVAWLDGHLNESVAPLLDAAWILDIDTTVNPPDMNKSKLITHVQHPLKKRNVSKAHADEPFDRIAPSWCFFSIL